MSIFYLSNFSLSIFSSPLCSSCGDAAVQSVAMWS